MNCALSYFRLLHGQRPFWWIQSKNMKNLKLFQTQITCETGPGNPSGHVMINMVIGLSIVRLLENLTHSDETNTVGRVNLFNDVPKVKSFPILPHQASIPIILLCSQAFQNDQSNRIRIGSTFAILAYH